MAVFYKNEVKQVLSEILAIPFVRNFIIPVGALSIIMYFLVLRKPKTKILRDQYGDVTYYFLSEKEAKERLDDENILIVDVRLKEHYDKSHLRNSVNLPFHEINKNCRKLIPNKKTEMFLYDNENGRLSKQMTEELYRLGYKYVYDIGSIRNFAGFLDRSDEPKIEAK